MEAKDWLQRFEAFLCNIPLEDYRKQLESIKTVEQDLPKDLNPLPAIYASYWLPETAKFPEYEEFFQQWWKEHLEPLKAFAKKYFWGCSCEFVRLGFKARIYRTLISVLTQFHFAYSWLAYCTLPLEARADLDMQGIDALVTAEHTKVALQIKKETYRAEAREGGRFAQRKVQTQLVLVVPYTIKTPDYWQQKAKKARNNEKKELASLFSMLATKFQRRLKNGFVVFQPDYPCLVEQLITEYVRQGPKDKHTIEWREILVWLRNKISD